MLSWQSPTIPRLNHAEQEPSRLRLFDTASQQIIPVGPAKGEATMYVCGITPYDATHLGHANTYLAYDLVNRVWRDIGLTVHYAQNVTDVDDPLLERASQTQQDWRDLAKENIKLFSNDMTALRVIAPKHYIGAVESIDLVDDLIKELKKSGLVYQIEDSQYPDWYFNTVAAPGYGHIAKLGRQHEIQIFSERGGDPMRSGKRDPLDCLLWLMARPNEPSWSSSLGQGRPGWHIECSAIALHYLGPNFDLQGGGSDLIFPHHEMCAAQAQVVSGKPLAKSYVHCGMLALNGEKMSKSLGNLEFVSRLLSLGVEPMIIRLALLNHHYRSDWEWSSEELVQAEERLSLWRSAIQLEAAYPAEPVIKRIRTALRNDLNTPDSLLAIDEWAKASLSIAQDNNESATQVSLVMDALLGVTV